MIKVLARQWNSLPYETVESAVKRLIEQMREALVDKERIEIGGFGIFLCGSGHCG